MATDHKDGDFQFKLESQSSNNQGGTHGTENIEDNAEGQFLLLNPQSCACCRFYGQAYCHKFKVAVSPTDHAAYTKNVGRWKT